MNTKHTPGPWTLHAMDSGKWSLCTSGPIAYLNTDTDPNGSANAHLIAAAPDLLETLENIRSAAFGSAKATAGDATRAAEALTTLGEWAAEAITKATTQQ